MRKKVREEEERVNGGNQEGLNGCIEISFQFSDPFDVRGPKIEAAEVVFEAEAETSVGRSRAKETFVPI